MKWWNSLGCSISCLCCLHHRVFYFFSICCCPLLREDSIISNVKKRRHAAQQVVRLSNLDLVTTHRCTCSVDKGGEECQAWITALSLSSISPASNEKRRLERKDFFFSPNPTKETTLWATKSTLFSTYFIFLQVKAYLKQYELLQGKQSKVNKKIPAECCYQTIGKLKKCSKTEIYAHVTFAECHLNHLPHISSHWQPSEQPYLRLIP